MMDRWQNHYTRDQLITQIRVLAGRGRTLIQVAEAIGHGLTRDQVAGFARRARPRIHFGQKQEQSREKLRFSMLLEDEHQPASAMTTDEMQRGDCRCRFPLWPHRIGVKDGKPLPYERLFCGAPAIEGRSWCPTHDALVHGKD